MNPESGKRVCMGYNSCKIKSHSCSKTWIALMYLEWALVVDVSAKM